MADKMRWRYGDTNPVLAAVDAATVIEIGDLVYQEEDDARPAASQGNLGGIPQNEEAFADKFLGVAMQRSRAGDADPIRVATTGVFEFDCPAGPYELSHFMAPCRNLAGDGLLNQRVELVADAKYAVARVARRAAASATTLLVDIRSTVMTGGIEGSSPTVA